MWLKKDAALIQNYMATVTHRMKHGRIWHQFLLFSSLCTSPRPLQKLLDVINLDIGGLDEMEAKLDKLGIVVSPDLISEVIDSCIIEAGTSRNNISRRLCRFFSWCQYQNPHSTGDEVFNYAIQAFAKMKDTTAIRITLSDLQKQGCALTPKTLALVFDTLVKLGEEDYAVQLFRSLDRKSMLKGHDEGENGSFSGILTIVHSLCAKGHASKARHIIWQYKRELLVNAGRATSIIHQCLLHGWCVHGNIREARRVLEEMKSLGISVGLASYNDLLYCICKRNMKFNPSALVSEATDLITEMRSSGLSPSTVSYNILLSCLVKVRRVKEAYRILYIMQQDEGSFPDCDSYYIVIRVMYLTSRFGKGNMLVDEMLKKGLLPKPTFFQSLVGLLCGLDKVEHALEMLDKMNKYCGSSNSKTYDLLITKLSKNSDFVRASRLWNEAAKKEIHLTCSRDLLDPSKAMSSSPKLNDGDKLEQDST